MKMNGFTSKTWFEYLRKIGADTIGAGFDGKARYAQRLAGPFANSKPHVMTWARAVGFAANWAESGFPTIEVADKLFASLACTSIPADAMPDIGVPWKTFVIKIPDRFQLEFDWGWGPGRQKIAWMSYEHVGDAGGNFELKPISYPGASIVTSFKSLGELMRRDMSFGRAGDEVPWQTYNPDDDKTIGRDDPGEIYRRVFVGACIEMMSPENADAKTRAAARGTREKRGLPRGWTFTLARPVVVDCREKVASLLEAASSGRRLPSPPSVQTLVRGHWKRQPYGTARVERKFIHIEPYWRGPESAPIAVRSHVLEAE